MRKQIVAMMLMTSSALAATPAGPSSTAYTQDGQLKFPSGYREWVYLTSGLNMTYQKTDMDHLMFDNVFVHPDAYRVFLKTGTWPDGTVLVKETRGGAEKGSINQGGKFQIGEPMDVEVHVKDTGRFTGGWAFFAFGTGRAPVPQIPVAAECYSCHRAHGWVDTTFVQFYPTLLSVAQQHGTVKAEH